MYLDLFLTKTYHIFQSSQTDSSQKSVGKCAALLAWGHDVDDLLDHMILTA